jgi:cysteine desulfurase/selenocysteine lyase
MQQHPPQLILTLKLHRGNAICGIIMDIDLNTLAGDFPIIRRVAYMNNASNAPMPFYSIKAMTDFLVECSENGPDSPVVLEDVENRIKEARNDIAKIINCSADEIVFTQSTTEGVNYVANGLLFKNGESIIIRGGDHEHPANYVPWMLLKEKGVNVKILQVDENGFFDLAELERSMDGKTRLVAISHALFNTGSILPMENVGRIAKESNVSFFVDAAQTVGCYPVDAKKINCDFMAFTGSKWLCGPMGSGVFYCRKESAEQLQPLQSGGESAIVLNGKVSYRDMPERMQAGFRNWVGIVGLAASVRYIARVGIGAIRERNMKMANMLREELKRMPNVTVYGPDDENIRTSVVSFNVNNVDPRTVVKKLDENKIIFAKRDISGKRIVRASPHFFNQTFEINKAVDVVKRL